MLQATVCLIHAVFMKDRQMKPYWHSDSNPNLAGLLLIPVTANLAVLLLIQEAENLAAQLHLLPEVLAVTAAKS